MMKVRTKEEHKEALKRIDALWSMDTKTALDEIEVLSSMVEAYEHSYIPIPKMKVEGSNDE